MKHRVITLAGFLLLLPATAWAGAPGTLLTAGIFTNQTGVTVNDLHVHLNNPAAAIQDLGGVTTLFNVQSADFTIPDVAVGDTSGYATMGPLASLTQAPFADSFYWTVDGTQQDNIINPVLALFSFDPISSMYGVTLRNPGTEDTFYDIILQLDGIPSSESTVPTLLPAGATSEVVAQFGSAQSVLFAYQQGQLDPLDSTSLLPSSVQILVATPDQVPEPATLSLFVFGVAGIVFARRRRPCA